MFDTTVYRCSNLALSSAAHQYAADTTRIILNNNAIVDVADHAFDGLLDLEIIVLSDNFITAITKGAFDELVSLQQLYLNANQIASISTGAFVDVASTLQVMSLSSNTLQCQEVSAPFTGVVDCSGCTGSALQFRDAPPSTIGQCCVADKDTDECVQGALVRIVCFHHLI